MAYLIIILLLILSALFSGLNLSLMSLGVDELKRKAHIGNKLAAKVYPVRAKGNRLLVSLLVGNVAANSILAIYLGSIASGIVAMIVSTALITVFAEVVPQALFSRFALFIGAKTAVFVNFIMIILYPVCAPLAWLLDKILGQELPETYSRKELIKILEEHRDSKTSDIEEDEQRIAGGALTFGTKKIKDVMVPRSVVVSLISGQTLDHKTIDRLVKHGYSRFPVENEERNKIVGLVYAYNLIKGDSVGKRVDDICDADLHYLNEDAYLDDALNGFIKTKHHMFIVVNQFKEYTGIVTIEDIIEEIIGKEIVDEFDEYEDVRKVAERSAKQPSR